MSKSRNLIKEYQFEEIETINLSEYFSFSFSNDSIINEILNLNANKILKMNLYFDRFTLNRGSSYIEFVGRYIKKELFNEMDKTREIYHKLISDNVIKEYHNKIDDLFIVDELSELMCYKLVKKNKNYLTPTTIFHSSYILRMIQSLKIELREKDVQLYHHRKEALKEAYEFLITLLNINDNRSVIDYESSTIDDSYFLSFNYNELRFDPDLNLINNILKNIKSEDSLYAFLKENNKYQVIDKINGNKIITIKEDFLENITINSLYGNIPSFEDITSQIHKDVDNDMLISHITLLNNVEVYFEIDGCKYEKFDVRNLKN